MYHYHGASDPQGAGPGTTDPAPDEPDSDPPTTASPTTTSPTTGSTGDTPTTGATEVEPVDTDDPVRECGNGIVEGSEECDATYSGNQDHLACTMSCKKAVCGDGHVHEGVEACDDGAANVTVPGYDQCSTLCARGPHCGDGVIQVEAGEECEPSSVPRESNNCPAMCRLASRLVFLTSTSSTGNLGGLAGADKRCNLLAAASDLNGSYRAWLLVDGQTLAARFPEFAGPPTTWNFTSMSNELLAKSFQQLVSQGPAGPLAYTEQGEVLAKANVWTNITATGLAAGGDCGQWTGEAGSALVGISGFVPDEGPEAAAWYQQRQWTDLNGLKLPCPGSYHLYCIQVSD